MLYGKALAKQIPDSTTGNQARVMFGAMTSALSNAYAALSQYDSTGIAEATGIDAGSVQAARGYLDSTNTMLQGYYPDMPADDAPLDAHALAELRTSASGASVAVKTIDDLFSTSFGSELCDSITAAAGTVGASIANAVSKVAGVGGTLLGSFIGGTWWLWLSLAVGAVVYFKVRKYRRAA